MTLQIHLLALPCCTLYLTASVPQSDRKLCMNVCGHKLAGKVVPSWTHSSYQCGLLVKQVHSELWRGIEVVDEQMVAFVKVRLC